MDHIWRSRGIFWAGAICASLWSWMAFALADAVMSRLYDNFPDWQPFIIVFGLLYFAVTLYCAAIIATHFWAKVADSILNNKGCAAWGTGTIMLILAPMTAVNPIGLLAVIVSSPLAWWSFRRGMRSGEYLWRQRRWRYFFGLDNDWEREEEQKHFD